MKFENTFSWGRTEGPIPTSTSWGSITGTITDQTDLIAYFVSQQEYNTIKADVIANKSGLALVNLSYNVNTEYLSGQKLGTKDIYMQLIEKGDIKSNVDIAASGTLINNVETFLGIEWGVISRKGTLQLHNINCVNNLPDQHSSIIYQEGTSIKWFYASTITLTTFKNRPFLGLVKYTKTI